VTRLVKVALLTAGWGIVCAAFVVAGAATDGDWQRLKAWLRSWRIYMSDPPIPDRVWRRDPDVMSPDR